MITVGIDEVGRGCWAGPLVAGAVILERPISGLKDSKKLSKKRRENLDKIIREEAVAASLGWTQPAEIDELGLTNAVSLAMARALAGITQPYDEIIIDGNYNYLQKNHTINHMINPMIYRMIKTIVRADNTVPAVSAASIVAKVARDNYMAEVSAEHTGYGFEKHVGYGTKQHLLALGKLGPCQLHRHSFKPIAEIERGRLKNGSLRSGGVTR